MEEDARTDKSRYRIELSTGEGVYSAVIFGPGEQIPS